MTRLFTVLFFLIISCAAFGVEKEPSMHELCRKAIELMIKKQNKEAESILQKLASQNYPEAFYHIGVLRFNAGNKKEASKLFEKAASQGSYNAKYQLGIMKLYGNGIPADVKGGIKLLDEVVNVLEDRKILFDIGVSILQCGRQWQKYAIKAWKKAAQPDDNDKGHHLAQFLLGELYMEMAQKQKADKTVPAPGKDDSIESYLKKISSSKPDDLYKQAYHYFELSAKQDHSDAWFGLGIMYWEGSGIDAPDIKRAKLCFLAAERCAPRAEIELNIGMASKKLGEDADAKKYFKMAADAKNPVAMYWFADYLCQEKKYAEARRYLDLALKHNIHDPVAVFTHLASLDFHEQGVAPSPQNKINAFNNFMKAAKAGNADSMYQISEMYRRGIGTAKDAAKADMWLNKAIAGKKKFTRHFVGDPLKVKERAPKEKTKEPSVLSQSINSHTKKLEQMTGCNIPEQLSGGDEQDNCKFELSRISLPESCRLAGWDFDTDILENKLAEKRAFSRDGDFRIKTDEFDKYPLEENLMFPNPSVRYINSYYAKNFIQYMKKKNFAECSIEETLTYLKQQMPETTEQITAKAWQINDKIRVLFIEDFTGRWEMRYYHCIIKINGKWQVLPGKNMPPDIQSMSMIHGVTVNDAAALNNCAANLEYEDDEHYNKIAKSMLLKSAMLGCTEAYLNLAVFHLNRKNKAEARKYKKLYDEAVRAKPNGRYNKK